MMKRDDHTVDHATAADDVAPNDASSSDISLSDTSLVQMTFVPYLPDLITEADYAELERVKKVRVRITITGEGVEILGDSPYPALLEALLARLGVEEVEKMLCG
jgi:hypothetical protein